MDEEILNTEPGSAGSGDQERVSELESENEALKSLIRIRDARDEITQRLSASGARSPALLFAYAVDTLQFNEEGSLQNAEAVIASLEKNFPEQFGVDNPPSINGGAGTAVEVKPLSKETLARMSPAEIAKLDWNEVRAALASK